MSKYEEGREWVRNKIATSKKKSANSKVGKAIGRAKGRINFIKGIAAEVKTHIPKGKKIRKSSTNSFVGSYGSISAFGSSKKKKPKSNNPFGF